MNYFQPTPRPIIRSGGDILAPVEDCIGCEQGDPQRECLLSRKTCGHHCNHVWTHDSCCWCDYQVPLDEEEPP